MAGGTLLVSRAEKLLPTWKAKFEEFGFKDVAATSRDKDGLRLAIIEHEPQILLICCGFYKSATPYMMGKLTGEFCGLNVAAVNIHEYPDELAMGFMSNGVNSYINILDGMEEFYRGLRTVRDGGTYVSEGVRKAMELRQELPKRGGALTARQTEIAKLLCSGFLAKETASALAISVTTVKTHKREIYRIANARNSAELLRFLVAEGMATMESLNFYPGICGDGIIANGRKNVFAEEWRRIA